MQAFYSTKPSKYEAVGNGSYFYRWDIKEVTTEQQQEGGETVTTTQWECQEVIVWAQVTCKNVVRTVLLELWGNNTEQKLINEYNSAQLGLLPEEEAAEKIEAYKTFLSERAVIKAQVEQDCKELGIN